MNAFLKDGVWAGRYPVVKGFGGETICIFQGGMCMDGVAGCGSVTLDLTNGDVFLSFGTDRMNAGGFCICNIYREDAVTVGELLNRALEPETPIADDTVIWDKSCPALTRSAFGKPAE